MVKHTPGPWSYEYDNCDNGTGQRYSLSGPNGRDLLHFSYNSSSAEEAEKKANARLMAAAPELLRAARSALGVLSGLDMNKSSLVSALAGLRVAIAKATGETP